MLVKHDDLHVCVVVRFRNFLKLKYLTSKAKQILYNPLSIINSRDFPPDSSNLNHDEFIAVRLFQIYWTICIVKFKHNSHDSPTAATITMY